MSNSIHHSLLGTFKALVGLEQLDLSFNKINLTSVDQYVKDVHPILPNLNYINLRGNPLVRLEEHIFYGLRKSPLKELNFQGCELESIDPRKGRVPKKTRIFYGLLPKPPSDPPPVWSFYG